MCDYDSGNEEEEVCHGDERNNNDEVKTLNEPEELTEKEHEQECFDLLIDERMRDNFHDVCLHDLINEENKILQEEVRENAKHWKDKIFMEKSMKEKEVLKIDR